MSITRSKTIIVNEPDSNIEPIHNELLGVMFQQKLLEQQLKNMLEFYDIKDLRYTLTKLNKTNNKAA